MTMFNMRSILDNVKNGQFAGIDIKSVPTMRKTIDVITSEGTVRETNPHYGMVEKVVTGNLIFLGASYENMINNRLRKEMPEGSNETFESGKLPWGTFVENYPVIEHKGKFYLRTIFEKSGTVQYYLNKKPVDKNDIFGLSEKTVSKMSQGGIADKIIIRNIEFSNIVELRAAKQTFIGPFSWR